MADEPTKAALNSHFSPRGGSLQPDVLIELSSILNLHDLTPQDLFYKWESYSMKMGLEPSASSKMDAKTARDLKRDISDAVEREARQRSGPGKSGAADRRGTGATKTPRNKVAGGDMFGMIDGVTSSVGRSSSAKQHSNGVSKRKSDYETPTRPTATSNKSAKPHRGSSPSNSNSTTALSTALQEQNGTSFSDRPNPGAILQTLNDFIPIPSPRTSVPSSQPRVTLKSNTDMKKFEYKTMGMKLSEASEILDDRIDQFVELVQNFHELEDVDFGNPAVQSQNEIVAVGRIASDTSEARLAQGSVVLETSRRGGGGTRVPLELRDDGPAYEFFPGKIVALRGKNASGEQFRVNEILAVPALPPSSSSIAELQAHNSRLESSIPSTHDDDTMDENHANHKPPEVPSSNPVHPLNILLASGPYTPDENLHYEPLHALIDHATTNPPDCIILIGPFLDIEHPLISSGRFPPSLFTDPHAKTGLNPNTATLTDVFRVLVSTALQRLYAALPSTTVILVPSLRDATAKHAAFPQDRLSKKGLGLPGQCKVVTNPATLSLNEVRLAMSSHDTLFELKQAECVGGGGGGGVGQKAQAAPTHQKPTSDSLTRITRYLLTQQHFYPLFPPTNRANLPRPAASFASSSSSSTAATTTTANGETTERSGATDPNQQHPAISSTDTDIDNDLDVYAPPLTNSNSATGPAPTATGPNLDTPYLSLLEFTGANPDMLVIPSAALPPFVKVVDSVVAVNPGVVTPRRKGGGGGGGTFVRVYVRPKDLAGLEGQVEGEGEEKAVRHDVWERCRVDVVRV
ncbi:MAG: DNA-directed DNA polymerase alpha subunit pol12 [Alyxoria varia]|nr:MAG: DNA-directed DNA polymerase alpha subunit pol12 [Alyxoria varia]